MKFLTLIIFKCLSSFSSLTQVVVHQRWVTSPTEASSSLMIRSSMLPLSVAQTLLVSPWRHMSRVTLLSSKHRHFDLNRINLRMKLLILFWDNDLYLSFFIFICILLLDSSIQLLDHFLQEKSSSAIIRHKLMFHPLLSTQIDFGRHNLDEVNVWSHFYLI